jgi:polysaccharide export outer membrane protein
MVEHPDVSIEVKQSRFHAVSVTGAVRTPVVYPILATTTFLDALSQAGGLADDAGSTAIVRRGPAALAAAPQQAERSELQTAEDSAPADSITVNLRRLLENGDTAQNVVLYPGDKVIVPRAGIIYVVGAVNRAGGFVMKDDPEAMTVLKALGLAGNLGPYAASKNAVIVRRRTDGSQEIPINLHQILERKAPDQKLLANDILFIPDSASKRALHTAGVAAAQAATMIAAGLVVYH